MLFGGYVQMYSKPWVRKVTERRGDSVDGSLKFISSHFHNINNSLLICKEHSIRNKYTGHIINKNQIYAYVSISHPLSSEIEVYMNLMPPGVDVKLPPSTPLCNTFFVSIVLQRLQKQRETASFVYVTSKQTFCLAKM